MQLDQKINEIIKIENSYDVNTIKYDNLYLWPLLRTDLIFNHGHLNAPTINSIKGLEDKLRTIEKSYFEFIEAINLKADLIFQIDKHIKGFLNLNNFKHHKLMDSLFELTNDDFDIKFFSHSSHLSNEYKHLQNKINIDLVYEISRLDSLYKFETNHFQIEGLKKYCQHINEHTPFSVDYQYIYYICTEFLTTFHYISILLKKIDIKSIFLDCYYATIFNYALTCAGNNLNIQTVDIQHGLQRGIHYSYNNFLKIPFEGYKLLPKFFWVWHKSDALYIAKWSKKTNFHHPIVGGHIFYTYLKDKKLNNTDIKKYYPENKLNILITLGTAHDYSDEITKAINELNDDNVIWHFREHPSGFDVYEKKIKNTLLTNKNVELEFSTNVNLYELFPYIDLHITDFSTTAFEILDFENISTIYTTKNPAFMKIRDFFYCDSSSSIINIIEKFQKNKYETKNNKNRFINHGIKYIYNALSTLE
jgi:hypothetical protein